MLYCVEILISLEHLEVFGDLLGYSEEGFLVLSIAS